MMKWRSTAEIKKIEGVEIGGGYQIWDIHILILKNIKKNVFIYYRFCLHLKNVILVSCAYYIRDYYACKNYYHAWIYYIWSVLSNLDFSKIGMHVTFTYSFVLLRRYLHWDSEMCCMHLFAHIFFIFYLKNNLEILYSKQNIIIKSLL